MELLEAHQQWARRPADERFESLEDLYSAVSDRHSISKRSKVGMEDLYAYAEADDDLRISALGEGHNPTNMGKLIPSNWAFSQVSLRAGAPASYLKKLPATLAADCLNHSFQELAKNDNEAKILVRDHESYMQLDAVTGHKYGTIWDDEVVRLAMGLRDWSGSLGKKFYNPKDWRGRPSGLYAGDRDVFIFMIDGGSMLDAGPRAQLNRGFFLWNSEVGSKTFGLKTFYFNTVCGNHIVWDASDIKEFKIRHTKNGHRRFLDEARPYLREAVMQSMAPMENTIRSAQVYEMGENSNDVERMAKWLQRHGFTRTESRKTFEYAAKEEGKVETLWDVVQGATAYAREMPNLDNRTNMEVRAGKLLALAG